MPRGASLSESWCKFAQSGRTIKNADMKAGFRLGKKIAIRCTAVWEAGVSRHHGGTIEGPLKHLVHHSSILLRGLREGLYFVKDYFILHYVERRQPLGQPMWVFFPVSGNYIPICTLSLGRNFAFQSSHFSSFSKFEKSHIGCLRGWRLSA